MRAPPSVAELLERMQAMPPEQAAAIDALLSDIDPVIWVPQDGPQRQAYESEADILFYGGAAGGGKTEILLGLSLTAQERSIIFRREAVQLIGLEERMTEILGSRNGYNGQDHVWRLPGKRVLELGSVKEPGDWTKYQGRPHDFKGFDEVCHFTEGQFRALIGWMRTDNPDVRQRVVCAGNPPTDATGEWVKRYWAPWLDPHHPNPAKSGELRWFVTNEKGDDQEVPGPDPVMVGSELMQPKSRTFIPSRVDDNLFLMSTGYKAQLQTLPEPLRSQMLRGDFNAGVSDPVWQLIPTEWVKAAQARWKEPEKKPQMTAIGFDPSRGGRDKSSAARRHGNWFDKLMTAPGVITKDGPTAAGFVTPLVRDGAPIAVDSIGIGSSALDFLVGLGLNVHPVVGSEASSLMDKAGQLHFRNKRAEMYWRLREALDPTHTDPIALPPDTELLGDLTAPRYKVVTMGKGAAIQINSKDEIREILGRSPDKGDSVAMTFVADLPTPRAKPRKRSLQDRLSQLSSPRGGGHWDQSTA
ncbi:terminase [Ottowia thiooxydans]|uniref:terminase n=1 Tax=Ottowia thiooxydans TaxID=219182 RepID=UPI001FDF411F|nr:terminase [Ottowia thiooxydans]